MKKFIAAFTLVFIIASLASAKPSDDREFIVKFGFQPSTKLNYDNKTRDMNLGLSVGLEFFQYFGNVFALGAGTAVDLSRKIKNLEKNESLSVMPIYFGAKIRAPLHGLDDTYPFISGRIGYGVPITKAFDNTEGGLYWSVGFGVNINVFLLEAVYSRTNISFSSNNDNKDADCSTIAIYAGFKFE